MQLGLMEDISMTHFGNPTQKSNPPMGLRIPFGDPEEDLSDFTWGDETRRVCLLLTHAGHFGQIPLTTTV